MLQGQVFIVLWAPVFDYCVINLHNSETISAYNNSLCGDDNIAM